MLALFRAIADRIRAMLIADAGLEFEAELLSRGAARKAQLLRQAAGYENEGLGDVAAELRRRAETICLERPLAGVLPALEHLRQGGDEGPTLLPFSPTPDAGPVGRRTPLLPAARKKGGKHR